LHKDQSQKSQIWVKQMKRKKDKITTLSHAGINHGDSRRVCAAALMGLERDAGEHGGPRTGDKEAELL